MFQLSSFDTEFLRRVLGTSYTVHIANDEVRATISKHMKRYEELLTTVKKRKLRWYGHVTRASGLSKTVLQGAVQGDRGRGRPRKKWTVGWLVGWLVGCLTSQQQAIVYLRDGSAQTILRAATLR